METKIREVFVDISSLLLVSRLYITAKMCMLLSRQQCVLHRPTVCWRRLGILYNHCGVITE